MYRLERLPAHIRDRLPALTAYFCAHPGVVVAYLFGSFAREQEDALSDVDIAVLFPSDWNKETTWRQQDRLAVAISDVLQTDEFDLVILNTAPLAFCFEIISTGLVLQSNDEMTRTDYEVGIMTRYWDFKKYLVEYDRHLRQRIKERFSDVEWQEYHAARRQARRMHRAAKERAGYLAEDIPD